MALSPKLLCWGVNRRHKTATPGSQGQFGFVRGRTGPQVLILRVMNVSSQLSEMPYNYSSVRVPF